MNGQNQVKKPLRCATACLASRALRFTYGLCHGWLVQPCSEKTRDMCHGPDQSGPCLTRNAGESQDQMCHGWLAQPCRCRVIGRSNPLHAKAAVINVVPETAERYARQELALEGANCLIVQYTPHGR